MQSTAEIYDELDNLKYLLETSSSLDDVILNLDQKTVKCITFEYVNQGFHNTPEDFQVSDPDLIDLLKRTTSNWFITKSKENEDDLFQSIENANSIIQYNRRTGGNFSTNEKHSVRNCDDIPIRTRNILLRNGINYFEDLQNYTTADLRALNGCGAVAAGYILQEADKLGIRLYNNPNKRV